MKIKCVKNKHPFGEYRATRVVWITTLDNQLLLECDVVDKEGNILYRILELPDEEEFEIFDNDLTVEELKEITAFIMEGDGELEEEWQDYFDYENEKDMSIVLGYFSYRLATCHSLARESNKTEDVIIKFGFDSSKGLDGENFSETVHFKKDVTEDYVIEDYLLPKLLEREDCDRFRVYIAKAGVVNSYLVTIQE